MKMVKNKQKRNLFWLILVFSLFVIAPSMQVNAKIELNRRTVKLIEGQKAKLKIIGTKVKVRWSFSNIKVATVNSKGVVTAKKAGKAKIIAKAGKKKYTCRITVKGAAINRKSVSLKKGQKFTLKIVGAKTKVKWSSNNKKVATVNSKGVVTAKKTGRAKITAKVGKKKYTCKVSVLDSDIDSVAPKDSSKDWEYITQSDKTILMKYLGNAADIVIPSRINNRPVTDLGGYIFATCSNRDRIRSVVIPKGITYIPIGAFDNCSSLISVTVPEGVTRICRNAFSGCKSLSYIKLPNSLTILDGEAFSNCPLKSITLPKNLKSAPELDGLNAVFVGCNVLQEILVDPGNAYYCSIGGVVFNKSKDTLIFYPGGKTDSHYDVPDGVEHINESALSYYAGATQYLKSMSIPRSISETEKESIISRFQNLEITYR